MHDLGMGEGLIVIYIKKQNQKYLKIKKSKNI